MIDYATGPFGWHVGHLRPETCQPRVALVFCHSSVQLNAWAKEQPNAWAGTPPYLFGGGLSSKEIVEEFQKLLTGLITRPLTAPIIIPTHRLELMSNDVSRPDCIFVLQQGKSVAKPVWTLTNKEIHFNHNLQKMWLGGNFD